MATYMKRKARTSSKPKPLDPTESEALRTGEADPDSPGARLLNSWFFDDGAELRRVWLAHRKDLLRAWRRIGCPPPYWIQGFIADNPPPKKEKR